MSSLKVEVVKIDEILKHENAERLDLARINDWICVVGKGVHKAGDEVIYIPIDSVLPDELIQRLDLKIGQNYIPNRIRAAKIRGVVSYGLIIPNIVRKPVGTDVATALGITKYEPEAPPEPQTKSKPSNLLQYIKYRFKRCFSAKRSNELFTKYTDIENFKHYPKIFDNEIVIITEKLHGTNARFGYLKKTNTIPVLKYFTKPYEFVYGSHNCQKHPLNIRKGFYGTDVWGKTVKKYNLIEKLKLYPGYIFYGEIYGPNIQDLTYGVKEPTVAFFDIKHPNGTYLDCTEFHAICLRLDLPEVPMLYSGPWKEELKELRTGMSVICPTQMREGIVIKPQNEKTDVRLGRKILKLVSENYLLRKGGTEFH